MPLRKRRCAQQHVLQWVVPGPLLQDLPHCLWRLRTLLAHVRDGGGEGGRSGGAELHLRPLGDPGSGMVGWGMGREEGGREGTRGRGRYADKRVNGGGRSPAVTGDHTRSRGARPEGRNSGANPEARVRPGQMDSYSGVKPSRRARGWPAEAGPPQGGYRGAPRTSPAGGHPPQRPPIPPLPQGVYRGDP